MCATDFLSKKASYIASIPLIPWSGMRSHNKYDVLFYGEVFNILKRYIQISRMFQFLTKRVYRYMSLTPVASYRGAGVHTSPFFFP